jgi:REP element-mobilizing transposase RayT
MKGYGSTWERSFAVWPSKKDSRVLEGYLMPDHVHMLLSSPPK